jgi:F0F1-type ATP synthase assembly protein I
MIKNFLSDDDPERPDEPRPSTSASGSGVLGLFDNESSGSNEPREEKFVISESEPESAAETMRRSGLAYSAGIAFFAAVVFMMILGWGADLLLGSSPWGIVGGIVLGSVIGFIQFFRLTSQIFRK